VAPLRAPAIPANRAGSTVIPIQRTSRPTPTNGAASQGPGADPPAPEEEEELPEELEPEEELEDEPEELELEPEPEEELEDEAPPEPLEEELPEEESEVPGQSPPWELREHPTRTTATVKHPKCRFFIIRSLRFNKPLFKRLY
jgi:hypothetical protein